MFHFNTFRPITWWYWNTLEWHLPVGFFLPIFALSFPSKIFSIFANVTSSFYFFAHALRNTFNFRSVILSKDLVSINPGSTDDLRNLTLTQYLTSHCKTCSSVEVADIFCFLYLNALTYLLYFRKKVRIEASLVSLSLRL